MADPNLGQLAATTLRDRGSEVADSVTNNNALLAWLKRRGKITSSSDGGRTYVEPIAFSENGTTKFYDGGMESFVIPVENIVDASEWDRKFQAGFIYFTESERQANKGPSQAVNLVTTKIENLKATLANDFSTSMYADGTAAKEVSGLQATVADNPTSGTVGGIDAGTYTWWRNQYTTGTTTSSSNIYAQLRTLWLGTVRGVDKPDLIVMGSDMFGYLDDHYSQYQRFSNTNSASDLDFDQLKFQSATVLFDPTCNTKRAYGLQCGDLKLVCDSGRKWAAGSSRDVTNATYDVTPVLWSGALVARRRESHFLLNGT